MTDPLCELRLDDWCGGVAEEVDHIVNVADGGDEWDWDNLQSACKHCHAVKTAREGARRRSGR